MNEDSSRRQILGRKGALLVLYGMDLTEYEPEDALEWTRSLVDDLEPDVGGEWELVAWRVQGVGRERDEVDSEIQAVSPRWRIERMAEIDRNILRVGAWELMESDIPPIVTINACVELAKEYGEESTPGFVNGLLDELCTERGIEVA